MFNENTYENVRIALVAEDDTGARTALAGWLRGKGYGVLEAATSVEALLLAAEFPETIDVLFTSLELRKFCNRYELAGCIKASRPEMAVVYLSGEGVPNAEIAREILLEESGLMQKPLVRSEMESALASMARRELLSPERERMEWA